MYNCNMYGIMATLGSLSEILCHSHNDLKGNIAWASSGMYTHYLVLVASFVVLVISKGNQ